MSVKKYQSFPDLSELEFFSDRINKIDNLFEKVIRKELTENNKINYNIIKKNNLIKIKISVPGYKESEIEIGLKEEKLVIKGKKISEEKNNKEEIIYKGIFEGEFKIEFNIGNKSKIINAELSEGLLNIEIEQEKKTEEFKKIPINKK
ncbi:small heat chock protein (plasmid) [endosymbiont of Sipalinus gigas]|uniref:Hsp20 family protein n=1 Tax=endosymbiont of Sipalinus gigas TaxID=1972134 RepID=UPI000DC6E4FB|nr:Hsp20 family protein [endosymbiont of Sipalinus gigas]BBA85386.1 small heat chock protein [endosymbiont of Sipalinus gigas]